MPWAPRKFCGQSGCYQAVEARIAYCPQHARERKRKHRAEDRRGGAAARGYGRRWRKARLAFLKAHPLCVGCMPEVVAAEVVDHIVPHKGDSLLFWDPSNWQPLCKQCHDRKTARESLAARGAG